MPDQSATDDERSKLDRGTVTEIATELGLSVATIRAWIHRGEIPAYKDGRTWTIKRSDVHRFLRENPGRGRRRRSRQVREMEELVELSTHGKPRRPGSILSGLHL